LTSVSLSLIGLFQLFIWINTPAVAAFPASAQELTMAGISSIPGSPKILAIYLVLGIPLLLSELVKTRSQEARDFWLVCTTISFVGIFFTQSRLGLFALLVTGTVFLYHRLKHALSFLAVFLFLFLFLFSLGMERFSFSEVHEGMARWINERAEAISEIPEQGWLIIVGPGQAQPATTDSHLPGDDQLEKNDLQEINNMHITLMMEHGIAGWLIMMWLILSALWAMKKAYGRTKDPGLKTTLWAIIASILGFLVSMNGMNTFHNLTIQIFFWSLIGIGVGIATQLNRPCHQNLIWRFGDAGD
jgi:hypothetical protein